MHFSPSLRKSFQFGWYMAAFLAAINLIIWFRSSFVFNTIFPWTFQDRYEEEIILTSTAAWELNFSYFHLDYVVTFRAQKFIRPHWKSFGNGEHLAEQTCTIICTYFIPFRVRVFIYFSGLFEKVFFSSNFPPKTSNNIVFFAVMFYKTTKF